MSPVLEYLLGGAAPITCFVLGWWAGSDKRLR